MLDAVARQVHDDYRRVRADKRTGIELYFSRAPLPADSPVHVFQHTMKTAGTAVRSLVYANLAPSCTYVAHDAPKSAKHDDLAAWYRDLLAQFSPDEQGRLQWAVGHTAAHLAPAVPRPVRLFTIVRRPIDQVLSRHWFAGFRSTASEEGPDLMARLREIFESPKTVKRKRYEGYWNLQSQSLLAPYYDVMALRASRGPTPDADLWRQRLADLAERSVLLVQDRLDEGIRWFGAGQQWRVTSVPVVRVNRVRPSAADLDPELRSTIEAYNWLDAELYRHAIRQHEGR